MPATSATCASSPRPACHASHAIVLAAGSGRYVRSWTESPSTARCRTPPTRENDSVNSSEMSTGPTLRPGVGRRPMGQDGAGQGDDEEGAPMRGTVVITGAAGRIGRYLRRVDGGLAARGWAPVLVDVTDPGEPYVRADVAEEGSLDVLTAAMEGAGA